MLRSVLVATVACAGLAGARPASAQSPPTQLDRVEQKLDTILHRLDQLEAGQAGAPSPPPSAPGPAAAPATTSVPSSTPETLAGGAVAIIHAAPATPVAAHEIPADSVGGFIYTGGPLQLADLADHGVRYAGLVGVEWQGWLRAREAGRYQFELDGSTVSANSYTNSTCVFTGWLEDRAIGVQEATPSSGLARPAPFSLVLGAELQPGLYKLRLWAVCTPTRAVHDQRVSVALLEKAPSDLNLRPVTGEDLAHKQRADHVAGSSRE
jgi:hypothetical protein